MKKLLLGILVFLISLSAITAAFADSGTLAFPGAEGGGKYSLGARGSSHISVYHVTSLADSGSGTLRDAVSESGRIIVFDVSGTIELRSQLVIKQSNLTILAQTAPGDGVTISGNDVVIDDGVENIIIRYLKVRPTDKNGGEPDGIGGRFCSNVIFDHCSVSWCVDELLTLYGGPVSLSSENAPVGNRLTIQNTIGSESLRMSNHVKGAHGYGAIWGGTNASYIGNLLAHHDSRSPRLDRELQGTDVSNNVIYDWGQTNSAYGAEPYDTSKESKRGTYVNWVGNYYKAGPATAPKLLTRIFDVTSPLASGDKKSTFFFSGNYINGNEVTNYKDENYVRNYINADILDSAIDMGEYAYDAIPAPDAYEYVLSNTGATLPQRDAVDARIINDVKNGTGTIINSVSSVGGLIPIEEEHRTFEIPAEWLTANNLSGKSETDIISDGKFAGYTVIEAYVNDWTEEQSKTPPTNPNIIVQSPATASLSHEVEGLSVTGGDWTVITEDEKVLYQATAIAVGENEVTKMELYDGNTKIAEFDGSEINTEISLEAGEHYLTSRAYNTRGEKTQSTFAVVYVKSSSSAGSYSFSEIRENSFAGGYKGKGGASMDENGVYTVCGSGRITEKANDNCGFMYKEVSGDFDITVRTDSIPKFENQQVSGLMVRTGLETNAVMAMIGDGWWKNGENVRIYSRKSRGASASETFFKDADGKDCDNEKVSYSMPRYMRIQRSGNTLTLSVSNTGSVWTDNGRLPETITYTNLPDTLYVGIATDSAYGVSTKESFSMAKFSRLTLNGESDVVIEDGKVPFFDERFDGAEWFFTAGSGEKDLQTAPLDGNSGFAALFWGEAGRSFKPQNNGVLTASADFYTGSNPKSNANAGVRFMLNGTDANGNTVKIKSVYVQNELGVFIDYDDEAARPTVTPYSSTGYELEKWYKIIMTLNYGTGKGTYSFMPYTAYNSESGVYVTGAPLFEYEFDFDTSIALSQIHFQRRGGWEMYLDNVELKPLLYMQRQTLTVDAPREDASLILAYYDRGGALLDAEYLTVGAGEVKTAKISDMPNAYNIKAFLWNLGQKPIDMLTLKQE